MKPIFAILFSVFLFSEVSGNAQTNDTVVEIGRAYTYLETNPMFSGGEKALIKFFDDNIKYPEELQDSLIEGRVFVKCLVEKDGSISNVEIKKSVHKLLDDEAIRVVKLMPNWEPAMLDGKHVRIYFVIPIEFKLK